MTDRLLIESFPRGNKEFLVAYCFEGRIAHQTLGMLLTRRMERAGLKPLGFVATDYVLATWALFAPTQDRDVPGHGFTHKTGDLVTIAAPRIGRLVNRVTTSKAAPPWQFGIGDLMRNLAGRGLLAS